jgi:hypothetical protein
VHRRLVEAVEAFADGLVPRVQLQALQRQAWGATVAADDARDDSAWLNWYAWGAAREAAGVGCVSRKSAQEAARWAANHCYRQARETHLQDSDLLPVDCARRAQAAERAEQLVLLRCVLGNPFRRVPAVDQAVLSWQDGVVVKLARVAYDDRLLPSGLLDPARLGVLADALEDASGDPELVRHLRGPVHVRGCHVIDALLAKA